LRARNGKYFKKFKNKAYMPVLVCRQGGEGRGFLWFREEKARFFGERLLFCLLHPHHKGAGYSQGRNKFFSLAFG